MSSNLQHIVETIQHDLDYLSVFAVQQTENISVRNNRYFPLCNLLAEWWDDALGDEVGHLGLVAADGQVGDGPGRLLLCLELPLGEVTDDHGHQPRLYHGLHLLLVARGDVGEEPDRFLRTQLHQ